MQIQRYQLGNGIQICIFSKSDILSNNYVWNRLLKMKLPGQEGFHCFLMIWRIKENIYWIVQVFIPFIFQGYRPTIRFFLWAGSAPSQVAMTNIIDLQSSHNLWSQRRYQYCFKLITFSHDLVVPTFKTISLHIFDG